MARRVAFYAGGWHRIPEVLGNIKVYAGGAGAHWWDVRQVDVYYGTTWTTVWKIPVSIPTPTASKPPVRETVYHTATTSANIRGGTAYWAFIPGRHITKQTLTYRVGLRVYSTPITLGVTHRRLPAGATKAVIRYTYY